MAWTTPTTFVDGNVLTAATLNTFVRDNMLETMPAKVTGPLQHLVAAGSNLLVARSISVATIDAAETTTSTSFVDLLTVGPSVTVTTGTRAIVFFTVATQNTSTSELTCSLASVAVSGATTVAAADSFALRVMTNTGYHNQATMSHVFSLTAGSNTFTMKYRCTAGTNTFARRQLIVIAL